MILRLRLAIFLSLICLIGAASTTAAVRVDSVGITVSDMDRALEFYTNVLPFKVVSQTEVEGGDYERLLGVFGLRVRVVRLALGEEFIELIEFVASQGRPIPVDSRSNDEWFQHVAIVVRDMDAAYAHLRNHKVTHASTGPQRLPDWNPNAGGISAFYFRDPDGNHLEILHFPKGKGKAKWHRSSGPLFLGIDHTAIVVRDTDQALKFYRDLLGLHVVGWSENYGVEQERLNNVFGARLLITSLSDEDGFGVELLDYIAPATGRPMPVDTRTNDLWSWHIRMEAGPLVPWGSQLRASGGRLISPGAVTIGDHAAWVKRGLLVRGPSGHAILLTSE